MTTFLILAVLVLGVTAVIRLSRLYELTAALRNKREELISERDNRMNSRFMYMFLIAYFAFFIWLPFRYKHVFLPVAASEHGVWIDDLYTVNWVILLIAFAITNTLLFVFAGKYYHRPGRKAYFFPHDNRWELAWTIVPSIVLIGIIIYGLTIWNRITAPAEPGTAEVEIYGKQFDWTMRYPGPDGRLGATDYRLINDNNPLGIVTDAAIDERLGELRAELVEARDQKVAKTDLIPAGQMDDLEDHIAHLERTIARIVNLRVVMQKDIAENGANSRYSAGGDDVVVKEFHLPVNEEVNLNIRSRDILHSVYIPHMRAQMNAVPGMTTHLRMVPTITTDSMRMITKDDAFNYVVLCNKICGASHYNMQIDLVVQSAEDYKSWLKALYKTEDAAPAKEEASAQESTSSADTTANVAVTVSDAKTDNK